ncbi:HupE/UreJ family protein [Aurantiacibacter rhizosphaerae]|uniref:HupE/UreJ family protein n=1 Tax=Aurantiacibacter rhizosphaerae TaxID=2691582 RepID=A0A844XI65_9SPHN|nr:HupE/UreJ family protein [Aurantiacibacter rhizosphaerae]MWV29238.1 hypothetical protein [Aurantiacibacter rhizosphaerae]
MAVFLLPGTALADDNRPLSVKLEQEGPDSARVTWKLPVNVDQRHMPRVTAAGCETSGRARNWADSLGLWREESWACDADIYGRQIAIDYPAANPGLATIVRFFPRGEDQPRTILLQPQEKRFAIARDATEAERGFGQFVILGIEHIWIGFDHLLFLAGLVLIAGTPRRILVTITGFTVAHSITLALSAQDLVRLPIAAIEAVIALSIVFLAVEIVKGPRDTLTWRKPVVVATAFGLLHGFGFAAVLREVGLPESGLIEALLGFNIGIEIGQIVFAAAIFAGFALLRRIGTRLQGKIQPTRIAGYTVGSLASFWMIERLAGI